MAKIKTNELLKSIERAGKIEEREILLLKNRKNRGEQIDESIFWDGEIFVSDEQSKKGLNWLMNQYKTPAGKERKNNPFGFREIEVLENFESFTFDGFNDIGRFNSVFTPVYTCYGGGLSFQYYVDAGKISICG